MDLIRSEEKELYILDYRSLTTNDYFKAFYLDCMQDGPERKEVPVLRLTIRTLG